MGKFIGGIIGFMIFGPIGALIGIFIGHQIDKGKESNSSSNEISVNCPYCSKVVYIAHEGIWNCPFCQRDFNYGNSQQGEGNFFLTTVFSLFAKLAKSDGIVTKEEVGVVDRYAKEVFQLDLETRKLASKIFNEAKNNNRSFEDYARDFYKAYGSDYNSLLNIVDAFLYISSMEKSLHPSHEKLILEAVRIFNISIQEYEAMKARYFIVTDKYYTVLGCNKSDSMEEVKRKYRKLVSEYHPDKIMAKNLPDDFIKFANERFKEIQEAYEIIRKEKAC